MCSLERNKNAGNLVVRRNDSTRPSFRKEKINCCSEEQWAGEACENIDAHEVKVRWQKGVGARIIIQWEETKEKARKRMFVKFYHVSENILGSFMYYLIEPSQPFEIVSIIMRSRKWVSKMLSNQSWGNTPKEVESSSRLKFSGSESVNLC